MDIAQVNTVKFIRDEVKKLLLDLIPANDSEWNFHDELTDIYTKMRKWDLSKLTQTRMNLDASAEKPKTQLPLTEGAAVVSGEESLNENTSVLSRDPFAPPLNKTPSLCLKCLSEDKCTGEFIHLVDGRQVCDPFKPKTDLPCSSCLEFHADCDILAKLNKEDNSCEGYHTDQKDVEPGQLLVQQNAEKPRRGRKPKAV